jgi:hypothetical protein
MAAGCIHGKPAKTQLGAGALVTIDLKGPGCRQNSWNSRMVIIGISGVKEGPRECVWEKR